MTIAPEPAEVVGRTGWRRGSDATVGGVWVIVAIVAVVVLVLALIAGVFGRRYLKLDVLDDYRDGYAVGQKWRAEGESGECFRVMKVVYGQKAADRAEGWGAFVAGCQDGLEGRESANWRNLRDHLPGG